MEGLEEAPSPTILGSKEVFFEKLKENIVHCSTQQEYEVRARELFATVPLSGVALNIKIARTSNLTPVGYLDTRILVNDEYYSQRFGKDYSDMLPYDLEHEMWEGYYATKKGLNPEILDLQEGKNRHFGRSHYLAVRKALRKAHREGKLDEYLEWMRVQMETLQYQGDTKATEELAYYQKEADKIRTARQKR